MSIPSLGNPSGFAIVRGLYGQNDITGTTSFEGTPSNTPFPCRVLLHDQLSGKLLAEKWSARVTGGYSFKNIRAGVFFVLSLDHTGTYSGAVETDVVRPEPAP